MSFLFEIAEWIIKILLFLILVYIVADIYLGRVLLRKKEAQRVAKEEEGKEVVAKHFRNLDRIVQDRRWVGAEAEIVDYNSPFVWSESFKQELLCKTLKGSWFVVVYHLNWTNIRNVEIHPVDEAAARKWLSADRELYIRHFELPTTA